MNRPARLTAAALTASMALLVTACGSGGGDSSSDTIKGAEDGDGTWQISWEGSGGARGDLPDGTFETTRNMTVQEIQSVDR
ncbi:hypothetical protein ACIGPN_14375 [Streptomyces afghaniensis]